MNLSIVIPAYNEAERIVPTILQFHDLLTTRNIQYELLVADDGSTDDTVAVVTALCAQVPQLRVLRLPQNRGKGYAVRAGMLAARGELRMFSDADGSTPVGELDKLLAPLQRGEADIVIGSRYHALARVTKKQPRARVLWSRAVNKLVQRVLLPGIADPHCGFKAYTAMAAEDVFEACSIDGWSFDLEVLAIARRQGLRIAEVPVTWANDERSKGRISQLPREAYNLWKIRRTVSS